MTDDDLIERVESALELPPEELADELPALLDDIEGQVEVVAMENPRVFARIVQRMDEMDIAAFADDYPDTVDRFMDVLWTGMNLLVRFSPDVQDSITEDLGVNFEASNAPMEGHLQLDADEGTADGGAELLDDPDITINGPANTLASLITGGKDPVQGFMQQEFEMDGDIQKGTQLAATMDKLTEKLPQ
ncbi:SCP2 sterol-binding domain-containing protein [Halorientalis litorea]|uniref:SCP2 sterol-binding domain-containing protein n=1 Tax=Halorientalis litorea TaxID=2931977 RepID=UPI001FF1B63D|nr:SCP2 sterol-binding domain-containing protein [Halorientalis litorea]